MPTIPTVIKRLLGALFSNSGVAACGLATSVLTALAVAAFARASGYNLFLFSIWVIIPVGAVACGFVAASGYYFGALFFHKRATFLLLLQMVLIAAFTHLLIYATEYETEVSKQGRRTADRMDFEDYMDRTLTKTHVHTAIKRDIDLGEAGDWGYWLALLRFGGFAAGGVFVFVLLRAKPVCPSCQRYFRTLSKKKVKSFASREDALRHRQELHATAMDGPDFAAKLGATLKAEAMKGSARIMAVLHGCPACKGQMIEEVFEVRGDKAWERDGKLGLRTPVPSGINLQSAFKD